MPANATRGARWKARSKKWLQQRGYQVADMEIQRTIWRTGFLIATKRDQWGADLIYSDGNVYVLVQVKGGAKPLNTLVAAAKAGFAEHHFPIHSRREVHVWRPRARRPEVIILA